MPELPEVETVRRGLEPVLAGRRLMRVEQRAPALRRPLPAGFALRLEGQRVETVARRGKYLLFGLEGGETWLVHLGMSGRFFVDAGMLGAHHHMPATSGRHDHLVLVTDAGARVTFNDARRFGLMDLWPSADIAAHPRLAGLGPEPLSDAFGPAVLARAFAGRRAPVKALLMDQRIVAGLGNIYASEALHRAGVHPARAAGRIGTRRIETLARAIVATLAEAVEAGGSSLRDHRQPNGELGYFQHHWRVYERAGQPCVTPDCGGRVRRVVQAGRSTYYCPRCQR